MMRRNLHVVAFTLCVCVSAVNCVFLDTPQSEVIYEGRRTTLTCHARATATFWRINGTIYNALNSEYFENRGITSFDTVLGPAHINKTLTIVGSALSNNTVVNCIALPQINAVVNVSEDALITVLGAPSGLARRVINSTSVEIRWRAEQYLPLSVTIQHYTISVLNTSDPSSPQQLQMAVEEGASDDSGMYSRVFNFDRELSPCSQITFSVTSTSSIGTSPPSNVTWETPLADYAESSSDFDNSLSCSVLQDARRLVISFKPPALCPYQSGRYTVSLLKRGSDSEQLASGSYSGSQGQLTVEQLLTDRSLLAGNSVVIFVTVASPYGEDEARQRCPVIRNPQIPDIGGLSTDPSPNASSGMSGGFIAGVVVCSLVVLLVLALLVAVLLYLYLPSRTQHTDSTVHLTSSHA